MIRINKYFTENGFCSRREADKLVADGRVSINGKTAQPGDRVAEGDQVFVDGKALKVKKKRAVVLAYHKPRGVISTTDASVPDNIVDAVGFNERVFNIGRLDRFSEGLILLTNLGDIVNRILRSRFGQEKEYVVDLSDEISDAAILRLSRGVHILGRMTLPCKVERMGPARVRFVLTEGINRQIRRMVESESLRVTRLRRVRIMHIRLGDLPPGEWRRLTPKEYTELQRRIGSLEPELDE